MLRQILILAGTLLLCPPVNSQNRTFPNAIHAKLNIVDYHALYSGSARVSQGFELGYFRNIAPFLNVGVPFKMAIAKLPRENDNRVTTSFDLLFHLENIRDEARISPYLFGGGGYFIENFKKSHIQLPVGVGVNLRISRYAFINLQGEFRKAITDDRDNVQLGAGFVYLLHKVETPPTPVLPPDSDKDGIPDVADRCPDQPGPAAALGCPDRDGDGLGDVEDKCPDQPGPLETMGCPDADSDGFADKDDQCPDVAGNLEGCPDRDRDGFADHLDECPDQSGRWNGCPDTDFDGVPDKDDDCPNDPGKPENRGCPQKSDADGDGFADADDECPDQPGTAKGCPDADADGVADKNDPCPNLAGKFAGCPDSDADGVPDNLDKCPNSPGSPISAGCPEIKQETKAKLAFVTKNIQFETGKATLRMESYAVLDELFNILKQYPDYKLSISGHTDNVGNDAANMLLSSQRAKACQDYLLFRGTPAERLRSAGFGASRPIASNNTASGREMNRRVEFELVVE